MTDIIIDFHSSNTWKLQSKIAVNFISSKATIIKFSIYNDVNEIVNEFFQSLLFKYQDNLETSMRGSYFIFNSIQLMHYQYCKVNFKRSGSYINSPAWLKVKNNHKPTK